MATTFTVLMTPRQTGSTQTTQYTAVDVIAVIDKFSVTNTSSSNVQVSVNLVPSGSTAGNGNLILKEYTVPPGSTYLCPELIGHVILVSGFISTLASAASSLTVLCSGREIS
jgi:hypothetical protein